MLWYVLHMGLFGANCKGFRCRGRGCDPVGGAGRILSGSNNTGRIMQIFILYLVTAVVFLGLDAVMLKTVMRPLFAARVGDWLLEDIRLGPAVAFYLFYVAGVVWFVSLPALRAEAPVNALIAGGVLGALAYGTYEFTNYATLRLWSPQMVAADVLWGTVLTGVSAWVGVLVARALA